MCSLNSYFLESIFDLSFDLSLIYPLFCQNGHFENHSDVVNWRHLSPHAYQDAKRAFTPHKISKWEIIMFDEKILL